MRLHIVGLGSALICANSAVAVESQKSQSRWTGPYVGATMGAVSGNVNAVSRVDCASGGFLCAPGMYEPNGAQLSATATGGARRSAFLGGGTLGYNFQVNSFVVGVEADLNWTNLRVSKGGRVSSLNAGLTNPGSVPVVSTLSAGSEIDWIGTLRGRAGYLVGSSVLLYATGGAAIAGFAAVNSYRDDWVFNGGAVGGGRSASIKASYIFGGGGEWSLNDQWTLRAEYLRLGTFAGSVADKIVVVDAPLARNPFVSTSKLTADMWRMGATLRF